MLQAIFENLLHFEYLGVFLISFIGSSTIFFPLPAAAFVFLAGGFLNPVVLGISAGLGAGLGELTGYGIGFGGHKIIFKKEVGRRMKKVIDVFKKKGTFYAIILLAATPLPESNRKNYLAFNNSLWWVFWNKLDQKYFFKRSMKFKV